MDEESDKLYEFFVNSDNVFEDEVDDVNDPEYDFLKDLESIEFDEDFESIFENNDCFDQISKDLVDQTVAPSDQFCIEHLVELHNQIRCHTQQLTQTWMLSLSTNDDLRQKSKELLEQISNEIFFKCGVQNIDPLSNEVRVFHNDIGANALRVIESEEDFLKSKKNISQRSLNSNLILPHYREVLLRHPDVFCFEWALPCYRTQTEPRAPNKRQISFAEDALIARFFFKGSEAAELLKITERTLKKLRTRFFPDLSSKTLSLHFKRYRAIARQIQSSDNLDSDPRLQKFSQNPLVRYFIGQNPVKSGSLFSLPNEFGLKAPKWFTASRSCLPSPNSLNNLPVSNPLKKVIENKFILPKGAEIYQVGCDQVILLPKEASSYCAQTARIENFTPCRSSPRMSKKVSSPVVNVEASANICEPLPSEMNEGDDFEDFEIENTACDLMDGLDESQQSISSNGTSSDTEETDDPKDLLALMQASWTPVHRRPEGPSGVNLKNKSEIRKHTKLFYTYLSNNYNGLSWAERRNMHAYMKFHVHRMKTILSVNEFEEFVNYLNTSIGESNLISFYERIQAFFKKCAKHHSDSIKKTRELKIYSKLFILFFNPNQARKLNKSFRHVHWARVIDFMSKVSFYIHYCYSKPEQRMLYIKRFASIMFKLSTSHDSFTHKLSRLKSILKKMFKGNALLLQEFRGLLLSEAPPEYLLKKCSDFENVDLDNRSEYDSIDLSLSVSDSNFGTKDCSCKCHSAKAESLTSISEDFDLQHCFSCSIRMISNRIFLPSQSNLNKRNQFIEYKVEPKVIENNHKPWSFEENRVLMLTCREYMLVNNIQEYSEDLYEAVAQYIRKTRQIERTVGDICVKLSQLLDSFEKFVNKT